MHLMFVVTRSLFSRRDFVAIVYCTGVLYVNNLYSMWIRTVLCICSIELLIYQALCSIYRSLHASTICGCRRQRPKLTALVLVDTHLVGST